MCNNAPGKPPRLTPNPAIALENGRLRLAFGTPGGDVQPQAMAQLLVNWRLLGTGLQEAVEAPRVASDSFPASFAPNPCEPGLMAAEGRIHEAVPADLEACSHRVERWPAFTSKAGTLCAVAVDPEHDLLRAAADPRRSARALGRRRPATHGRRTRSVRVRCAPVSSPTASAVRTGLVRVARGRAALARPWETPARARTIRRR